MTHIIIQYQMSNGNVPFRAWLLSLKDAATRARIRARLDRLSLGNFGDCKSVGKGIFELRFHFGSGYRIYYGRQGPLIVVLLSGGDKKGQQKDIRQAQVFWQDYLRRARDETGKRL